MKTAVHFLPVLLAPVCCLVLSLQGCDDGDRFDHTPPAGQGSLVVDNTTADGLNVYQNGYKIYSVSAYDHELVDTNPGVYRVVIDERNGYHSFRGDIDIVEGQLTVIEVLREYSSDLYEVNVYFD